MGEKRKAARKWAFDVTRTFAMFIAIAWPFNLTVARLFDMPGYAHSPAPSLLGVWSVFLVGGLLWILLRK